MTQRIKLMADYQCWPLWWAGDDGRAGNINPAELPLSADLCHRLEKWAATFDGWLDLNDPTGGKQPTPQEQAAFNAEGEAIWAELKRALAPHFDVLYFKGS